MMYNNLGIALARQGKVFEALDAYRAALRIKGDHINAMNNLAWLLATCPDDKLRNGVEAVRLAEKARALGTNGTNPHMLDVLAAAYAEAGQFAKAAATAERAVESASAIGDTAPAQAIQARLQGYRSGRPYRDQASGGR